MTTWDAGRRHRRSGRVTASVLASMLLASACTDATEVSETSRAESIRMLRTAIAGDYSISDSPADLRDDVDIAGEGVIERVYPGAVDGGPEMIGVGLIDVRVTQTWTPGAPATVTVLFPWAPDSPSSLDDISAGLPAGTKVAFFADPTSWPRPPEAPRDNVVVETAAEGLMIQTVGEEFQQVWVEDAEGKGWRDVTTFPDLRRSLESQG